MDEDVQTCLVFGGNGFLGSHLTEGLVSEGHEVRVFDNFSLGMNNLVEVLNEVEILEGDFLDTKAVSNALIGVDYVFHYISTTIPATAASNPVFDIETNVIGSVKMFQLAAQHGVKRIIFPSSGGTIYGETLGESSRETDLPDPLNPYAISKLTLERHLRYLEYSQGVDYTILRYSNPYGERQNPYGKQGVIPIFLNEVKHSRKPVIYGDGSMVRDYIYIGDAVEATISIFKKDTHEKIFNVGSGKGTSLNELVNIIAEGLKREVVPEYIAYDGIYIPRNVLNIERINGETGWEPKTKISDGIKKTWEWIKAM